MRLRDQALGRRLRLGPARRTVGQLGRVDLALVGLHPRHMGIAEHGEPIGRERDDPVDGRDDVGHGLARQAVHQVEVDLGDSGGAERVDGVRDRLERLHPVDGALDRRREVLDAEARPRDAEFGERGDDVAVESPRIDLDGDLGIVGEAEPAGDAGHQSAELGPGQQGRRSAAPMNVGHDRAGGDRRGDQLDLARQHIRIRGHRIMAPGDAGVAAAVPAHPGAERHVEIERYRAFGFDPRQPFAIRRLADAVVKMGRRRIARIARHAGIVARGHGLVHGAFLQASTQHVLT